MKKAVFLIVIVILGGLGFLFFNKKDANNNAVSREVVSNKNLDPISQKVGSGVEFDQNAYHPIIFSFKDENGVYSSARLLGGSKDGKWVNLENQEVRVGGQLLEKDCSHLPGEDGEKDIFADIAMVKGGENYRFYSSKKYLTSSAGMKPILSINGYTLDKIFRLKVKPFKVANTSDLIIGINAQWNALPRTPQEIDNNTVIIDLDNDGKTEKIVREEKKNEEDLTNDVSYVVEKQTKKLPVGEYPTQIDGDKFKECRLLILDLNGDGKMELIIFENGSNRALTAFELKNDKMVSVLGYYYGD